jgi:hypothetical protein
VTKETLVTFFYSSSSLSSNIAVYALYQYVKKNVSTIQLTYETTNNNNQAITQIIISTNALSRISIQTAR